MFDERSKRSQQFCPRLLVVSDFTDTCKTNLHHFCHNAEDLTDFYIEVESDHLAAVGVDYFNSRVF